MLQRGFLLNVDRNVLVYLTDFQSVLMSVVCTLKLGQHELVSVKIKYTRSLPDPCFCPSESSLVVQSYLKL